MIKRIFVVTIIISFLSSFSFFKKDKPKLPKEYVYVPAGTFWEGDQDTGKRISIWSFYISKYEISNLQYRTFLNEVKDSISQEECEKISVDSTEWPQVITYG